MLGTLNPKPLYPLLSNAECPCTVGCKSSPFEPWRHRVPLLSTGKLGLLSSPPSFLDLGGLHLVPANLENQASAHLGLGFLSLSSPLGGQRFGKSYNWATITSLLQLRVLDRGEPALSSGQKAVPKRRAKTGNRLLGQKGPNLATRVPRKRVRASASSLPPAAPSGAAKRWGSVAPANKRRRRWQLLI